MPLPHTRLALTGATAALALITTVAPAFAAATTSTVPLNLTGEVNVGTLTASATEGDFSGSVALSADLTWSETGAMDVGWDTDDVRQGRGLDPTYTFDPASGHLTVRYSATVTGTVHAFDTDISISPAVSVTASGTCLPGPDGEYGTCTVTSPELTAFEPCPSAIDSSLCPVAPRVTVQLRSDVQIGALQASTTRTATSGGVSVVPAGSLMPTPSTQTDELFVGCRIAAGNELRYTWGDVNGTREFTVTSGVQIGIDVSSPVGIPLPIPPFTPLHPYIDVYDHFAAADATSESVALIGAGGHVLMGEIQPNNVPPTLTAAASFSGSEGTPIAFSASASGPCVDGGSYVWRFSDGATEYGAAPMKPFADSGPYTGSVTFTDVTGLSDTRSFTVAVSNVAPRVTVTPTAPTLAWGRDLTLSAQAVDPGSADQSTLTYAWSFGDGTEVADGGPSETHRWAMPGVYPVSLMVCDKDGGCTSVSIQVTVTKRTTTTSYTGANTADHSGTATLAGSIVDEFGSPVSGATVAFRLGGDAAGSATTGASGSASRTHPVGLSAGSYAVSASFDGSALYAASESAGDRFDVAVMGSTLTYTGSLTSKPNAVLPVSVKLVDALGRPLANRSVTVTIGSQSTTMTTNAQGVGTGSIKLKQKPGSYQLVASWAGDAGRYAADDWSGTFKLNSK